MNVIGLKGLARRNGLLVPKFVMQKRPVSAFPGFRSKNARSWGSFFLFLFLGSMILHELGGEQEPDWKRLDEEVFSQNPVKILKEVEDNRGNGVAVYVIDTGDLEPGIADRVKSINKFGKLLPHDILGAMADPSKILFLLHGTTVVSRLVGLESSLVPEADINYYQAHQPLDLFFALYRLSKDIQGPAVVTSSIEYTCSDEILERVFLKAFVQFCINRIAVKKGIAMFTDSGNEVLLEPLVNVVPRACQHVWPVGNLTKSADGVAWIPHETSGQGDWIPFFAPGTDRRVCHYDRYFFPEKQIVEMTGSSYSAPAAAAFAARLLSLYPWMNRRDLQIAMEYVVQPTEFTDPKGNTYRTRCLVIE